MHGVKKIYANEDGTLRFTHNGAIIGSGQRPGAWASSCRGLECVPGGRDHGDENVADTPGLSEEASGVAPGVGSAAARAVSRRAQRRDKDRDMVDTRAAKRLQNALA
jgi:hypothetical protein